MTRSQKTRPIESCTVGAVRWQCSNGIRIATDAQHAAGARVRQHHGPWRTAKPTAAITTAMKSARVARGKIQRASYAPIGQDAPIRDRCVAASTEVRNVTHAMSPVIGPKRRSYQTRPAALQANFGNTTSSSGMHNDCLNCGGRRLDWGADGNTMPAPGCVATEKLS